jgi:hypothetical protein
MPNKIFDDEYLHAEDEHISEVSQELAEQEQKAGVSAYLKVITRFFEVMFSKVWHGFTIPLTSLIGSGAGWLHDTMEKLEEDAVNAMVDEVFGWGLADEETAKDLRSLADKPFPLGFILALYIYFKFVLTYVSHLGEAAVADIRRKIYSKYEPADARPNEVIQAAFIAPEKTQEVRQILKNSGFSEQQIDLMFLSMYRLYDENTIRNLYLREVLNEEQLFERMRELGYTDTRIKEIVQSWPIIPNPADLFHLVAKEAFEPDMIEHYGYDDEFPEEQVKWLKAQGYSEYWAKLFWYAHWDTPPIQAGYEMMHRYDPDNPEQKIIDEKELYDLFRTIEIPPFWRDKLTKIAYQPLTRVDVRRMHDLGVLTDEELVRAYEELGYHRQNAERMANFTIRYNRNTQRDLSKSEILAGFRESTINRDIAVQLLQGLEYSDAESEYLISFEEYKQAKELQDMLIDNVKKRYQKNIIERYVARSMLIDLEVEARQIDIMIDRWEIDKLSGVSLPSKTDLSDMLAAGVIKKDRYRFEMFKLGYSPDYVDLFEQLETKKGKP